MSLAKTEMHYDGINNSIIFPDGRKFCDLSDHAVESAFLDGYKIADWLDSLVNPYCERPHDEWTHRDDQNEKDRMIAELESENARLIEEAEKVTVSMRVSSLKSAVESLERRNSMLSSENTNMSEMIDDLEEKLAETERSLTMLRERRDALLRTKDEEIAHLRSLVPGHRPIRMKLKRKTTS